jgi:hypothetical protein
MCCEYLLQLAFGYGIWQTADIQFPTHVPLLCEKVNVFNPEKLPAYSSRGWTAKRLEPRSGRVSL